MHRYAREDTHYLLYIYDRLRNQLLEKTGDSKLFRSVLERSEQLCLRLYEKPASGPTASMALFRKHSYKFTPRQMRVFAAVFDWRDKVLYLAGSRDRVVTCDSGGSGAG